MARTNYIWDEVNDTLLAETDEAGNTIAEYTHEPGQFGPLISQRRNGQTSYHHYDGLGSTRALTDESGNVTDTYTYDAWGNEIAQSGRTANPFRWVGRWGYYYDVELAVYYVRARDYSPAPARWLPQDPLFVSLLMSGWSLEANLYKYVDNSPTDSVDPEATTTWNYRPERGTFTELVFGSPNDISANHPQLRPAARPGYLESFFNLHWQMNRRLFVGAACCKCSQVGFIQIVKQQSELYSWIPDRVATKGWALDSGIPYGYASFYNTQFKGGNIPATGDPCKIPVIGMQDAPGVPINLPWFAFGWGMWGRRGSLFQEFETCVVCLDGTEGPEFELIQMLGGSDSVLSSFTTYGCVKWSHEFRVSPAGMITKEERKVNGNTLVSRWFIGALGSNPPSSTFKHVVSKAYVSTFPQPLM
jgi:RHS repeat-associated protein